MYAKTKRDIKEVKRKKMEKKLKSIVVSIAVFAVLFGSLAPIQAQPPPTYIVVGQVFDTDGTTPVGRVSVTVTCPETTESVSCLTRNSGEEKGWYSVDLGNVPYRPPAPGDTLRIVATYGTLTNTTTVPVTESPQMVHLILRKHITPPTVEFIPPTPANGSINTTGYVNFTVNVTQSVPGGRVDIVTILVRNEAGIYLNNETMTLFGEHKYYHDAQLPDGNYTYKAYAKDIAGNTGVSKTRVLTVNVTEHRFTSDFAMGYNMITLPLNDSSVTKASSLAAKIGGNCTQISKWNRVARRYVTYVPGVPLKNFDIVGGEGYFVKMSGPETVVFTGKGWESPFAMSLVTKFNMIGIPVNDTSVTKASSLAAKIGGNCAQISKWNRVARRYVTYVPGVPLKNFDIVGGEGYFVKMTGPADVTFEGEPW